MSRSSRMLYLWIAAVCIASVISHDCAFIPQPITPSNDSTVVQVDCQRRQPDGITGDNTCVVVYLVNCNAVPVGLFVNVSATLSTVAVLSNDSEELLKGTFVGLANIAELRLEGFKTLRSLSSDVFRPLRSLERLLLVGFGAHRLSFAELGAALCGLSGTPLSRIVMHEIHSFRNEKTLDVSALFQMRNVSVREISFSDNVITDISGRPSLVLPDLRYLCVGSNARYYAAMNSLLDAWMLLPNINEITIYAYPVSDTPNPMPSGGAVIIDKLDPAILWYLLPYLTSKNCYSQLQLPIARSLRRLTVRNFQLLDAVIDKPFCFAQNNIEYFDGQLFSMTVRPLPSCPDFYRSATFIAPVVVGCVLALFLIVSLIALYRHRKDERLHRILRRVSMRRIVRLGIQHLLARNRDDDPRNFRHDVFIYIQVCRYADIVYFVNVCKKHFKRLLNYYGDQ